MSGATPLQTGMVKHRTTSFSITSRTVHHRTTVAWVIRATNKKGGSRCVRDRNNNNFKREYERNYTRSFSNLLTVAKPTTYLRWYRQNKADKEHVCQSVRPYVTAVCPLLKSKTDALDARHGEWTQKRADANVHHNIRWAMTRGDKEYQVERNQQNDNTVRHEDWKIRQSVETTTREALWKVNTNLQNLKQVNRVVFSPREVQARCTVTGIAYRHQAAIVWQPVATQ